LIRSTDYNSIMNIGIILKSCYFVDLWRTFSFVHCDEVYNSRRNWDVAGGAC
jgi:hypothetical protein